MTTVGGRSLWLASFLVAVLVGLSLMLVSLVSGVTGSDTSIAIVALVVGCAAGAFADAQPTVAPTDGRARPSGRPSRGGAH